MSKDVYHELFVHVVWHTKDSRSLIQPAREQELHNYIRRRAVAPGGIFIHEIGGTDNHVHLVARVNPSLLLSEWIGKIKGGSSYDANHAEHAPFALAWQSGYGLVTFGMKDLPWVIEYVQNQKQHHCKGTIAGRLELITDQDG